MVLLQLLMARVIIRGKDYGVSSFFIQIRDMGNHHPLPGIVIGDIGPKL
jgi:acyl-CoA oxidase